MKNELILKEAPESFNNMDDVQGLISGFANVYNIKDSHGDISDPASFVKTVTERKSKILSYRNHDKNLFVGVPTLLDPYNSHGLETTIKMNMNTDIGRDTYHDAKFMHENGFDVGFSIGGYIVKRDSRNKSIVKEYRLNDISILTKEASNQESFATVIKSIQETDSLTQERFWELVTKAYNNHKYSDTMLSSLESFLKSLDTDEPDHTVDTTPLKEPKQRSEELIKSIYSQFI